MAVTETQDLNLQQVEAVAEASQTVAWSAEVARLWH